MRIMTMLTVVLLAVAAPLRAEEPKEKRSMFMTFFKHLKEGLTESSVKGMRQKGKVTAVAAVRGTAQDDGRADPDVPAMKSPSRARKSRQEKLELKAFESAVDLINEGKVEEGDAKLAEFETAYPNSFYLPQVQEARAKIKEMLGAGAAPEAAAQPEAQPAPAPAETAKPAP